jgi:hypothetical protein
MIRATRLGTRGARHQRHAGGDSDLTWRLQPSKQRSRSSRAIAHRGGLQCLPRSGNERSQQPIDRRSKRVIPAITGGSTSRGRPSFAPFTVLMASKSRVLAPKTRLSARPRRPRG